MNQIGLYWHTLRYLKPVQFWYRLYFKLFKPSLPSIETPDPRPPSAPWQACARPQSMLAPQTFRFLNEERELSFPAGWETAEVAALWRYNLHYFDDLVATDAAIRRDVHATLIRRWIVDNPGPDGTGWEPYPCSLRIVNWIKWSLGGNELDDQMRASLAAQAGFLEKRIEYHLQGNHLWANAKALVFAGAYFSGPDADRWLEKGLSLVREQSAEQLLADGGHYERSPMYHAIFLEDMIDLVQLGKIYPELFDVESIAIRRGSVASMLRWLATMTFPDDGVAFFNDSANGIAPTLSELIAYGRSIGCEIAPENAGVAQLLRESGYVRLQNSDAVLLMDVGEIGPDYQPGHGHADTLSFEMALFGKRLIVNSGIDRYGESGERIRQRGTAAHSTVEIDGRNSSEVWGGFRVARRARPFAFCYAPEENEYLVACSHDGYTRLSGNPIHARTWELEAQALSITDVVGGDFSAAVGRFHIHPDAAVSLDADQRCLISHSGAVLSVEVQGGRLSLVKSSYHPQFGLALASHCLRVEFTAARCATKFAWGESRGELR